MDKAKAIEITVTKEDLQELIEHYQDKESRNASDRMMIVQLELALENFELEQ